MLAHIVIHLLSLASTHSHSLLVVSTVVFLIWKLYVFPLHVSPLKNVPGPYFHRISNLPSIWAQYRHRWVRTIHDLHQRYGDVVILGPQEVSCNGDLRYINDIYVKNMPKSAFYKHFQNHGYDNVFSTIENGPHLKYKKMMSGLYSKSTILSSPATRELLVSKARALVDRVHLSSVTALDPDWINARSELNHNGKGYKQGSHEWLNQKNKITGIGIDVYSLFGALAMDVISAFELGVKNGTDFLNDAYRRQVLVDFRTKELTTLGSMLFPSLSWLLAGPRIAQASKSVERWLLSTFRNAELDPEVSRPTTFSTLKKNGVAGEKAYSFLSDNLIAGHETSAIALTYICYELSRPVNRYRQERLRNEIQSVFGPSDRGRTLDAIEQIDQLPYMEAVLKENFRVHTSGAGSMPRVTPSSYEVHTSNGPVSLPKGTTVSCQAYSYHRKEDIFPHPDRWIPERWLPQPGETEAAFKIRKTHMSKHLLHFGKGIRMCLGKDLALIDIKLALANLYWRYTSQICSDWCEVTHYDDAVKVGNEVRLGDALPAQNTDEEMMGMVDGLSAKPRCDECWLEWVEVH
ncbi:hypothetical protein ACI3LY_003996 [Candidozyma auris]|uniref:Cytochrome P450 n=2 Tax=Candidozyma auris TaxID=498019 RepID=A0A2H1A1S2_CANAR|nr:hypothetical protein QG37_06293 [[Candida] auris]PIS56819.1 hypothetical protein B9J08_001364 [[Candida] auris]QWW23924.1 hypothetical protein CA7LBN_002758 [[Candida] auris]